MMQPPPRSGAHGGAGSLPVCFNSHTASGPHVVSYFGSWNNCGSDHTALKAHLKTSTPHPHLGSSRFMLTWGVKLMAVRIQKAFLVLWLRTWPSRIHYSSARTAKQISFAKFLAEAAGIKICLFPPCWQHYFEGPSKDTGFLLRIPAELYCTICHLWLFRLWL